MQGDRCASNETKRDSVKVKKVKKVNVVSKARQIHFQSGQTNMPFTETEATHSQATQGDEHYHLRRRWNEGFLRWTKRN